MEDYKTIALVLMLIVIGFKGTRAATCSADTDCQSGETCVPSMCTCPTGSTCDGATCSADTDCQSGETCVPSMCTCPTGSTCGVAVATCSADTDCQTGETCVPSMCTCPTGSTCDGATCSADADCQSGETCVPSMCTCPTGSTCGVAVDTCTDATDCQNGETCDSGTCTCPVGSTCDGATTPATRIQGTLQCYSCLTNSITDVCSTADDLASGSGVSTVTCYEEQRCWTDHYENSSHTVVSRGCTDEPCIDLHEGGGPYCTMANNVTSCTSCCTESNCNDNKSSSEGLTSSCVTWLTSLFSVVIMLITYRT